MSNHGLDADALQEEKKKSSSATPSVPVSPGPVVNQLDDLSRETFATGRPLEDNPELQQCKHCKKSILKTAAKAHVAQCLKVKKEKAQRKKEAREARERAKEAAREEEAKKNDDDNGDGKDEESEVEEEKKAGKKAASKKPDDKASKKRKADVDIDKGPKAKKKKDEPKAKLPKPKGAYCGKMPAYTCPPFPRCLLTPFLATIGPVDVERQCGVLLPNGQPCARSLTCKSHPMGAKRAVSGRSLPYDMLLAAYQKKNQAKQQSMSPPIFAYVQEFTMLIFHYRGRVGCKRTLGRRRRRQQRPSRFR